MQVLSDSELHLVYFVSVVFGSFSNFIYLLLLFLYLKQGCIFSVKKGLNILLCFTLIIHNCTFYYPGYKNVLGVSNFEVLVPSSLCKALASVKDSLKLINCSNFSLLFMYTYMLLYHTEFIMNHKKKFFVIFIGFFWSAGIIMFFLYLYDKEFIVNNIGECEARQTRVYITYISYFGLTTVTQLFAIVMIFFKIKDVKEERDYKNKKKLYILGLMELAIKITVPLFFTNANNPYICITRISLQIMKSLIFIIFYAYDEETISTLKEVVFCKTNEYTPEEALLKMKEMQN